MDVLQLMAHTGDLNLAGTHSWTLGPGVPMEEKRSPGWISRESSSHCIILDDRGEDERAKKEEGQYQQDPLTEQYRVLPPPRCKCVCIDGQYGHTRHAQQMR